MVVYTLRNTCTRLRPNIFFFFAAPFLAEVSVTL
jgi:hypothetical protein